MKHLKSFIIILITLFISLRVGSSVFANTTAISEALTYLQSQQASTGQINGWGGESDWAAIAFSQNGLPVSSVKSGDISLYDFLLSDLPASDSAPQDSKLDSVSITIAPTPTPTTLSANDTKPTSQITPSSTPKNHCQVLEAALAQGKLSSLNLKFFPSLSSYAVYQINGLGDTNQVWWTYSVNGQQPPYGCSQVMVNQGDVIHWTYAGSR